MVQLSLTEKYMVLLLNATGKHTDLTAAQYTAGIVLGGIYELIENGHVTMLSDGKVKAVKPLSNSLLHLKNLYEDIRSHSERRISKWLDYYCFSTTSKNIRAILNDMYNSLSEKGILHIEVRHGILKTKKKYSLYSSPVNEVSQDFQEKVLQGNNTDEVVFSVQMLLLADVFKSYFSVSQRLKIKSTLSGYKKCSIWKNLESYVNSVQNFNYQNSVNSGAM